MGLRDRTSSPYHRGALGFMKVIDADQRLTSAGWGRCGLARLLHFSAALHGLRMNRPSHSVMCPGCALASSLLGHLPAGKITVKPVLTVLTLLIILVTEQPLLWAVEWRPPGLVAARGVASDLDVAAACFPRRRAVASFPGDRDRPRPPRMVGPALGRSARHSHPASKTHVRT